jgi:hypothetical protein
MKACRWPRMDWRMEPVPTEHKKRLNHPANIPPDRL